MEVIGGPKPSIHAINTLDCWLNVSGFLMSPWLNHPPDYIAPPYHVTMQTGAGPKTTQSVSGFGMMPLVHVDGADVLLLIGAYALVFAASAIVLTRMRDVQE